MNAETKSIFDSCKLVYNSAFKTIKTMAGALRLFYMQNGMKFNDKSITKTFDIALQYSLLQVAVSDKELNKNEMIMIRDITNDGDLLEYLKHKTGIALTWEGLFQIAWNKIQHLLKMMLLEMKKLANDFVQCFIMVDKVTEHDYLSDLINQIVVILKGLSYMDGNPDGERFKGDILILDCLKRIKLGTSEG